MSGDPLGDLNLSEKGILDRDAAVFKACIERNIPILMVLSGGYQRKNANAIALSIINLFNNVLPNDKQIRVWSSNKDALFLVYLFFYFCVYNIFWFKFSIIMSCVKITLICLCFVQNYI